MNKLVFEIKFLKKEIFCQVLVLLFLVNPAFSDDFLNSVQKNSPFPNNKNKTVTSDGDFDQLFSDEKTNSSTKKGKPTSSDADLDELFSDEKTASSSKEGISTTSDADLDELFLDEKTASSAKEGISTTSDADLDELFSDEKTASSEKEGISTTSDADLDELFSDEKATTAGPENKLKEAPSDSDLKDLFSNEQNTIPSIEKTNKTDKFNLVSDENIVEEKNTGFLNDIAKNLTFELKLFGNQYDTDYQDTFVDDAQTSLLGRMEIGSSASINDQWSFNSTLLASYSSGIDDLQGIFYGPGTTQRKARILETKEAYILFEEEEYDVSIGRSVLSVGLSELFSPANRYGLADAMNPSYTEKLGVWKTTINYYIEDDSISYSILPYNERSPGPDGRSRWLGKSGDPNFFGLPSGVKNVEEEFRPVTDVASWGHLLKYNAVREGYDFFFSVHHGPSSYFVILSSSSVNTKINPLALTISGGFAKTIEEWKLYTEAAYQKTNKNQDEDFIKYVLGVSYRETEWAEKIGLEEISPIFEYAGEINTSPQLADNFTTSSRGSRPGRNTIISKIDFRKDDVYSFTVHATHNLSTSDTMTGGYLEYSYNDNLTFQIERRWFNGDDDTQFGRWDDNDFTGLNMQYKF